MASETSGLKDMNAVTGQKRILDMIITRFLLVSRATAKGTLVIAAYRQMLKRLYFLFHFISAFEIKESR